MLRRNAHLAHLPKEVSTKMSRSKRGYDLLLKSYKYKDFVFKLTKVPVLGIIGRRILGKDTTVTYVPIFENLELPPGTVAPVSVIEHFINEASDHFILSRCPCRSENGCEDFDRDFGCTFLGPAVREINPEVGRLVSREEALEHLRQATEAGLVSSIGKFKGDAIAMGVRDHEHLVSICHCCPCCCVATSVQFAAREERDHWVKLEGVTVEVTDSCNGCGLCVDACIFKQMSIADGVALVGEECKGCGRCAMACKRDGIRISIDNPAYADEFISRLSSRVAVR